MQNCHSQFLFNGGLVVTSAARLRVRVPEWRFLILAQQRGRSSGCVSKGTLPNRGLQTSIWKCSVGPTFAKNSIQISARVVVVCYMLQSRHWSRLSFAYKLIYGDTHKIRKTWNFLVAMANCGFRVGPREHFQIEVCKPRFGNIPSDPRLLKTLFKCLPGGHCLVNQMFVRVVVFLNAFLSLLLRCFCRCCCCCCCCHCYCCCYCYLC